MRHRPHRVCMCLCCHRTMVRTKHRHVVTTNGQPKPLGDGWGRNSAATNPPSIGHGGGGGPWTACGQRCVDSKTSQTTPATTSTSSIRQLLGAADTQTAHHATFSTAPGHQLLGSANAETTPARAPAAAADRTQQPDATCEGKNGDSPGPRKETTTRRNVTQGLQRTRA